MYQALQFFLSYYLLAFRWRVSLVQKCLLLVWSLKFPFPNRQLKLVFKWHRVEPSTTHQSIALCGSEFSVVLDMIIEFLVFLVGQIHGNELFISQIFVHLHLCDIISSIIFFHLLQMSSCFCLMVESPFSHRFLESFFWFYLSITCSCGCFLSPFFIIHVLSTCLDSLIFVQWGWIYVISFHILYNIRSYLMPFWIPPQNKLKDLAVYSLTFWTGIFSCFHRNLIFCWMNVLYLFSCLWMCSCGLENSFQF